LLLMLAVWVVRGCAYLPWNREVPRGRVRITVSRDFGRQVLRDLEVGSAGLSAMEALRRVAEVETSYGGGFISSIDGLSSAYRGEGSRKEDWFFYVNGQMADVGAADYLLREEDWVVFDYHSWERSLFTPVLAGCFPQLFLRGYPGAPTRCLVVYGKGLEEEAGKLVSALLEAGAVEVSTEPLEEIGDPTGRSASGEYSLIVAGDEELEVLAGWRQAVARAAVQGLFALPEGDGLVLLDEVGKEAGRLGGDWGLVTGLAPRLGEPGSALLVTGRGRGLGVALEGLLRRCREGDSRPLLAMAYDAEGAEIPLPCREVTSGQGPGASALIRLVGWGAAVLSPCLVGPGNPPAPMEMAPMEMGMERGG